MSHGPCVKFLSNEWRSFAEGKSSIESVLTGYDRLGFDANQDLPGNVLWEEMYRASEEFKINCLSIDSTLQIVLNEL